MTTSLNTLLSHLQTYNTTPIENARALPMDMYTSQELFDLEMETIFRQEWMCVGREEQVENPGDYFTLQLAGEPIVVVRGADGTLRALSSVCRHRYMTVVEGSGNTQRFMCPYHRWIYEIDGTLRSALHMEKPLAADGSPCRLPKFHLETWLGFVFITLNPDPQPFTPRMGGAEKIMKPYKLETWKLAVAYDDIWEGNWKLGIETGLEGYHIEGLHSATFAGMMTSRGCHFQAADELWNCFRLDINFKHPLGEPVKKYAELMGGDELVSAPTLSLYPSVNISCSQGNANWLTFLPLSPGKSRVIGGFLVPPDEFERLQSQPEELAMTRDMIEEINEEDASAMVDLQRNAHSRYAEPGQLNVKETALLYFYRYLADRLAGPHK